MTRISYNPILSAGDEPSRNVEERAFVASGSSVIDIDSTLEVADTGDFYSPSTDAWQDGGRTTAADTSGDLFYFWDGGRTTGTNRNLSQATSSSRPEVSIDGTYGRTLRYLASAFKSMTTNFSSTRIYTHGVRHRVGGTTATAGVCLLGANDTAGSGTLAVDGLAMEADGSILKYVYDVGTAKLVSGAISDTDWHTVVALVDSSGNAALYVDDMSTPVDTAASITPTSVGRTILSSAPAFANDSFIAKHYFNNRADAVSAVDLGAWLEAE